MENRYETMLLLGEMYKYSRPETFSVPEDNSEGVV